MMKRRRSRLRLFLAVPFACALAGLAPASAKSATAKQAHVAVAAAVATRPLISPPSAGRQSSGGGLPRVTRMLAENAALRIVAFGSSSTQGIGASSQAGSYPSRLQADLLGLLPNRKISVINEGVGGDDAADMIRRLPKVIADRPDLVIFQTGTNDPLRGLPIETFIDLTRDVVTRLRAERVDVMLMEPQLCRVTASTPSSIIYRDAVRAVASDMDVPLIRRWDLMQGWLSDDLVTPVQMLAPDGLHMADAGYALLAHEVARRILADAR